MKTIAIVSGGMDSVTLAYDLKAQGHDVDLLTFDYGQRHRKEIDFARRCAEALGARWDLAELPITDLLSGSSLTSANVAVPDGHYTSETMKVTVVPNRNAIMLAIAVGAAVSRGADAVATAVHSGDHAIYPDCRKEFIRSMMWTAKIGCEGFISTRFQILAPYVDIPKDEIVLIGDNLDVPWNETWSCYKGTARHCGTCGTCVERQEAFLLAEIFDPTEYVHN